MKFLLFIFLFCFFNLFAEIPPNQYRVFQFDPPNPTNKVLAYRVYISKIPPIPGSTNFLFATTNNTFIVSNLLAIPQRVIVTSSNVWGEEDVGANYDFPNRPVAPSNLQPIENLIEFTPPLILEATVDFVNYNEQLTISKANSNGVVFIRFKQQPTEPFKFFRTRGLPPSVQPPALP